MNYRLILRQEAERDLDQAYNWYNVKVPGLGSDFLVTVERALESIQANPERFPIVYRKVQRALLRRFPYGIFFCNRWRPDCRTGCHAHRAGS